MLARFDLLSISSSFSLVEFEEFVLNRIHPFIPIFGILLIATGVLLFLRSMNDHSLDEPQYARSHEELKIGDQIPDFEIYFYKQNKIKLSQLSDAKVILINFWAEWCAACLLEMPSIDSLYQEFKESGLKVIALSVDDQPKIAIKKIIKKLNISLPMAEDFDQKLSEWFNVHGIPFTVILDHNRNVLYQELGERNWDSKEIRDQIRKWLVQSK